MLTLLYYNLLICTSLLCIGCVAVGHIKISWPWFVVWLFITESTLHVVLVRNTSLSNILKIYKNIICGRHKKRGLFVITNRKNQLFIYAAIRPPYTENMTSWWHKMWKFSHYYIVKKDILKNCNNNICHINTFIWGSLNVSLCLFDARWKY